MHRSKSANEAASWTSSISRPAGGAGAAPPAGRIIRGGWPTSPRPTAPRPGAGTGATTMNPPGKNGRTASRTRPGSTAPRGMQTLSSIDRERVADEHQIAVVLDGAARRARRVRLARDPRLDRTPVQVVGVVARLPAVGQMAVVGRYPVGHRPDSTVDAWSRSARCSAAWSPACSPGVDSTTSAVTRRGASRWWSPVSCSSWSVGSCWAPTSCSARSSPATATSPASASSASVSP